MIDGAHERLLRWSQQVIGQSGRGSGGSSIISLLMMHGGILVHGTGGDELPLDCDAREVEKIIVAMDRYHRRTVSIFYLRDDLSTEQQAKKLGCSVRTLWRRVHACNVLVDEGLKNLRRTNVYRAYSQKSKVIHKCPI